MIPYLKASYSPFLIILTCVLLGILVAWLTVLLISLFQSWRNRYVFQFIRNRVSIVLYFFFPVLFITVALAQYKVRHAEILWLFNISKVLLVAISTWLVIRVVVLLERLLLKQLNLLNPETIEERRTFTKIKFFRRLVVLVVVLISLGILLLSSERGREYGVTLLTSAGIVSVIVGFAAQKSLANLLASFQIAFSQPIKINDTVVVEGETGRIEEINTTYVVVRVWDMRRLVVPITYFIEKPFQNWTRNETSLIGSVIFYLDYSTPLDPLREKLRELVIESPLWDGDTCTLQVVDTNVQSKVVRVLVSARDSNDAFDLRCLVRERLLDYINEKYPGQLPASRLP